jgi:hypothetical protein
VIVAEQHITEGTERSIIPAVMIMVIVRAVMPNSMYRVEVRSRYARSRKLAERDILTIRTTMRRAKGTISRRINNCRLMGLLLIVFSPTLI